MEINLHVVSYILQSYRKEVKKMLDINNIVLLTDRVKSKAVANNQLATARVAGKIQSELHSLDTRSYQSKQYLASVVPKLQQLDKLLGY
jgi:hypothetical protein